MAMSDLVAARWKPIWTTVIPGQGEIAHGDIGHVPEAEARDSEHWDPVTAAELEQEPKTDLVEIAERAGVEDPDAKTKPQLAKAIAKPPKREDA